MIIPTIRKKTMFQTTNQFLDVGHVGVCWPSTISEEMGWDFWHGNHGWFVIAKMLDIGELKLMFHLQVTRVKNQLGTCTSLCLMRIQPKSSQENDDIPSGYKVRLGTHLFMYVFTWDIVKLLSCWNIVISLMSVMLICMQYWYIYIYIYVDR